MTETLRPRVALAGNPNCGKTALFNALTGGRQKVGNYPGVTVERKEGHATTPSGLGLRVLDLPGTYSLDAQTPDEAIARDVILGRYEHEPMPEALVAVADATNLERSLGLVLEIRALGTPVVLALNMMDLAAKRGLELSLDTLSRELGVPVVPTVAIRGEGMGELLGRVEETLNRAAKSSGAILKADLVTWKKPGLTEIRARFTEVDRIVRAATVRAAKPNLTTDKIDRLVLHPVIGIILLVLVLTVMFQAIFSWATIPQDWIRSALSWGAGWVSAELGPGPLQSLIADGIISGVGSILVFLPQILLLFFFILVLEDSGYMSRAAFLMDRVMGGAGLNGRAFIPLLSSYACAIPGIMATRTIANRRDRFTTILIAPLTTCSARLPVYTLLISAFIPNRAVWGPLRLQGLVMLGLYAAGITVALAMAAIFRATLFRGPKPELLMELPTYKLPSFKGIGIGLIERSGIFLRRAGTVILAASIVLWFLASYPKPPKITLQNAPQAILNPVPAIDYSFAGKIGHALEPLVKPIGFNWRIAVALIPGFAAREVMISALGTVYAVEGADSGGIGALSGGQEIAPALGPKLAADWSLATALSLLVWYVLACQCLSTLAVTRRETNSWKWPAVMLGYMTALAYAASFLTYHLAVTAGWGA